MRKREYRMTLRFTKDELDNLDIKVKKAGMSREAYCRKVLSETEVVEAPNVDVHQLIYEIRRIGINIDQILKKAYTLGFIDAPLLRKELQELSKVERTIVEAYSRGKD